YPIKIEAVVRPEGRSGKVVTDQRKDEHAPSRKEGGPAPSGFYLGIGPQGRWAFALAGATGLHASHTDEEVPPGRKAYLVAMFNPRTGKIGLWVDGAPQEEPVEMRPYRPSGGPVTVGGQVNKDGSVAGLFRGRIDWVRISKIRRFQGQETQRPDSGP